MRRLCLLLITCVCLTAIASAQKVSGIVKGTLLDSASGSPLADATVSLISLPDSSLVSFTLTNNVGFFEIKNLEAGEYLVTSSFVGLRTFKKTFAITAAAQTQDVGTVKMIRSENMLEEVVIAEAPVKVNGDTISYKADAFKTKPNATVEDLLKKLPGVQVERDGTVKTQGETVQKVYVDGKEFFSNDPKLATKNLTAEMVDRVEVYDDMSEQAKFNGIDDGSRSKAINLKLKKDKKKGIFGKAYAGGGTNERYDVGLTANAFKGAMQANLIAKSNNTNNIGYTLSDMLGMFGSGGGMGGLGGANFGGGSSGGGGAMGGMSLMSTSGGSSNFGGLNLGNTGGGITKSSQAGLNYRDTWSQYLDVNGSYFYNNTGTQNQRNTFRQSIATDSSIHTDDKLYSNSNNQNHRFNLNMVWKIDSFNSIIYQPNVNMQSSESMTDDTLFARVVKDSSAYRINESRTINNTIGNGYNWSNNLLWRHRFRKAGRTLSVNLSNTWSDNNRDAYSIINSKFYDSSNVKFLDRIQDFVTRSDNSTNNYSVSVSYTEPLSRDKVLELNYNRTDNNNISDRRSYNRNPITGKYDGIVDSLTNLFENSNLSNRVGANFRVVKKKYNYQLGMAVQQTLLASDNRSKGTVIRQTFNNFFPTASFNYNFQRSRSLRINYRGRTAQPSATQLQDVTDITNYPYLTKGNPALKQEFSHNLTIGYNFFDILRFRNLFAFITYSQTQNKIASSVQNLPGGVQLTMPVNVNGVYNVNGNFNIGFPIKKLQGGNFNTTSRIGYNQDVSMVDGRKNLTRNLSLGEDVRLSYNRGNLDLGTSAGITFNRVQYTLQPRNNSAYFMHIYSADATYTLPKNFILSTDFDYTFNTGLASGFNRNYAIWNASLAKQVFKNKRGEIKASVFDLLNQNTSVYRNIAQNYIEDVRNTVLKRYFLLTFTYNINRMGGKAMPKIMERATRGIRVGG